MVLSHRRSSRCNYLTHARLVTTDNVEISLDNHHVPSRTNRLFCLTQPKHMTALVVQQRLRGVEVFWCVFNVADNPPGKANHLPAGVHQWNGHTTAKQVSAIPIHQATIPQFIRDKALFREKFHQCITRVGCIPNLKICHDFFAQFSLAKHIFHGMLISHQIRLKILCCQRMRRQQSLFTLSDFFAACALIHGQVNTCFSSQVFKCLAKVHTFNFHHKTKDIATTV